MSISKRTTKAIKEGGWIRRMFEIGIELKDTFGEANVFDLSLGNPVIEPPPLFAKSMEELATSSVKGMHRYMPNAGYISTRSRVAELLSRETSVPFTANEIVMTCGAAGALNVIFESILNPGDEVIIFAPFFGEFTYYIENHQGRPVIAPTDKNFHPTLSTLESLIGPKTRAVLINSPNNPSGSLYPESLIRDLGSLLEKKQQELRSEIFLIADEPYRRIIFDGLTYPFIFPHYEAAIAVHSHSKDLAVPGERIGYIAVNPGYRQKAQLIDGLTFWNRSLGFVNAPAVMQNVIESLQGISVDIAQYQKKRDYLYNELTSLGYDIVKPQGAFYMYPKIPINDDLTFVQALQKENVLVVPGSGFGTPGYFRISYCVENRVLEGSMHGFAKVAKDYGLS
jgi:aspartate aminotransferase